MRKHLVWMAIILVSITIGAAQQTAHTVFYNGKILTVDSNFSTAQAVAVRGNRILAAGTDQEVLATAGPNTLRVDLKGKTMIPGLINTHVHLEWIGAYARELGALKSRVFPVNVRGLTDKDEILQRFADVIAAFKIPAGEWLYFQPNWTGNQAELMFNQLNATELDKASPDNPIVVRMGMTVENSAMVNGVAIGELWRKYGDFIEKYGRYWIDAAGKPAGMLEPPASRLVWEDDEFGLGAMAEDVAPYFRRIMIERYSSSGVTTLSGALNTSTVRGYQWLDARDEMPLRYAYGAMAGFHPTRDIDDYQIGSGTDTVFVASVSARANDGGGIRMCIGLPRNDEAIQALRAGEGAGGGDMNQVAAEWWPTGQCNMDIEYGGGAGTNAKGARINGNYFAEWYRNVAQRGLRSANAHVSGDRSVTLMIDEWERIDRASPGSVKGWAFDHCNLVNPADIPRAAQLGLFFSCSPGNAVASEGGARSPLTAFGADALHNYASPFKSMTDAGINVSLEGEGQSWWGAIETMLTRKDRQGRVWGPHERVDRQTALKIATQNGANYILKGDVLGSIEPGKFADMLILDAIT